VPTTRSPSAPEPGDAPLPVVQPPGPGIATATAALSAGFIVESRGQLLGPGAAAESPVMAPARRASAEPVPAAPPVMPAPEPGNKSAPSLVKPPGPGIATATTTALPAGSAPGQLQGPGAPSDPPVSASAPKASAEPVPASRTRPAPEPGDATSDAPGPGNSPTCLQSHLPSHQRSWSGHLIFRQPATARAPRRSAETTPTTRSRCGTTAAPRPSARRRGRDGRRIRLER
jgi:hypothetical protein